MYVMWVFTKDDKNYDFLTQKSAFLAALTFEILYEDCNLYDTSDTTIS